MPDRDLPDHLQRRLAGAVESGAPLSAPQPEQARYAIAAAAGAGAPMRGRLVLLATACAALLLLGLAGSPQPRSWILQSAGNIANGITSPTAPSPLGSSQSRPAATPQIPAGDLRSPSPSELQTPEASESPEPASSPEPSEAPQPSPSPEPSEVPQPSPMPSDGG